MAKPYEFHDFTANADDYSEAGHEATYCPEDNKLRLYFAHRLDHDEWQTLVQAHGFTWSMKQDCDLVAHWTPERAELCRIIADGYIGDEDYSPAQRAADRAERFAGYQANREADAHTLADRYEDSAGDEGHQDEKKAERAAARRNRLKERACDQWSTVEYWNQRQAGVIANALYKLRPDVRARRIKKLQAEHRRLVKSETEAADRFNALRGGVARTLSTPDTPKLEVWSIGGRVSCYQLDTYNRGMGTNYRAEDAAFLTNDTITHDGIVRAAIIFHMLSNWSQSFADRMMAKHKDGQSLAMIVEDFIRDNPAREQVPGVWQHHYDMRLAYEQAMLEAELGGRLACDLESIERGGMWRGYVIRSASQNKTSGKYRGLSIHINGKVSNIKFTDTDLAEGYEAPTADTIEQEAELWKAYKATQKAAAATAPTKPKLINPTLEDARKLQAQIAAKARRSIGEPKTEPLQMTQVEYSARSKSAYGFKTREVCAGVEFSNSGYNSGPQGEIVCKVRCDYDQIIVITDKPQKSLPDTLWTDPRGEARAKIDASPELQALIVSASAHRWSTDIEGEQLEAWTLARLAGYACQSSMSQFALTESGREAMRAIITGVQA